MTVALPSLRRFALLNSDSDQPEVKEAVSLLISDLRSTISKSKKPGAARKSVAELLNFLHSMKTTVHPGRGPLAQAISNDIIPLLYEETAKPDTYKFVEAEEALSKHVGVIFKRTLEFLRAETPYHPAYNENKLEDNLPVFCFFDPKYAEGVQEFIAAAIKTRFRTKRIESSIYRPLFNDYIKGGHNPLDFFEQNNEYIQGQICEILDWGYRTRAGISDRDKEQLSTDEKNKDYSPDEVNCLKLLDKLKFHSEQNSYFLPQCAGFRFLKCLFNLDQEVFVESFNTITSAVIHGENKDYIVRQLDRLASSLDSFEFDLVTLCHHNQAKKEERLPFSVIQDSCIGSAAERSRMIEARPLISSEIGRRPVHLAKLLCAQVEKKSDGIEGIRPYLEEFGANISRTNKIRFEPEIKVCAGMLLNSKPLRILANWIEKEKSDESLIFMRNQQVETELKKIWKIK